MLITDRRERSQWGFSHIRVSPPHSLRQYKNTDAQKCEHFQFLPLCNSWRHRHFAKFMRDTCGCQHVISAHSLAEWHPLPQYQHVSDTTKRYLVGSRNLSLPEVNVVKGITSAFDSNKQWYGDGLWWSVCTTSVQWASSALSLVVDGYDCFNGSLLGP